MKVSALHPEDLLDRARAGTLSAAEAAALDQHCAECAACRLHRSLPDGSAAGDPAVRSLAGRAADLALSRLLAEPQQPRRSPRRRGLVAAAIGATIAIAGSAAATTWLAGRAADRARSTPASSRDQSHERFRDRPARPAMPAAHPSDPTPAAPAEQPAAPAPTARPSDQNATAASLFAQANRLRRRGAASEAARVYGDLQGRYPATDEALLSRVILGRLLLDRRGEPLRALEQFDTYLRRPGAGTLREEAMIGRAIALGRLGRTGEERRAWRALLAAFPDSMYSEKARLRLAELDPGP